MKAVHGAMLAEVVTVGLAFLAFVFALHLCTGCSSPQPTAAQVAAEGAYGAALLKCVDDAKTLQESKACRARVDAEWGITQTAKDGGR